VAHLSNNNRLGNVTVHVLYFGATYITVSDTKILKVAMDVHQWVPSVVEL